MAQAIHCDWEGDAETPADVLVSQTADGSTSAWCFAHYVDVCRSVVETVESTIREAADREAAAKLEGVTPPPGSDQGPGDVAEVTSSGVIPTAPDLGVSGFRPEGDQPVQEGLGDPETPGPGQSASDPTDSDTQPGGAANVGPA